MACPHWETNKCLLSVPVSPQAASGELDKQGRDVDFASGEMEICWEKTKASQRGLQGLLDKAPAGGLQEHSKQCPHSFPYFPQSPMETTHLSVMG